jgi:hypothetical protein
MKKILILLFATFFSYSNLSVAADFKMPKLPEFNLPNINGTIGIGATTNLGHAKGSETGNSTTNTHVVKEGGVFVDDSMTVFAELNLGDRISLGVQYLADDLATPESENTKNGSKNTLKATFSDITTMYARLNVIGGFYIKAGFVEGDIETLENVTTSSQSGSTVPDQDLKGDVLGIGHVYEHDNGLQLRTELMYADYDVFKVTDTSGDIYDITTLESLQASIMVAKAF